MIMLKQGIDSLDGRYEMTPAARTAAAKRFRTACGNHLDKRVSAFS